MDILSFIASVVESTAWPLAIVLTLWLFRKPLTDTLKAIENAKLKVEREGTSLEVEINRTREKFKPTSEKAVPEEVKKLAETSPVEAISASWADLERSATSAASVSMTASPFVGAETLVKNGILTEPDAEVFYDLARLKDEALSGRAFVTDVSSKGYSEIAYTLSEKINQSKRQG